jgi:hypothetical protein
MRGLLPSVRIERSILFIRGQKVMLDADLAELYGVSTKALNQAVRRNRQRFPDEFMFRLTMEEKDKVVTDCDHLRRLKFSHVLPNAFTEHGALMLASVLKSRMAVQTSLLIVRAFIRMREVLMSHKDLARRLDELEKNYDSQFKVVFDTIRELMAPPSAPQRRIGFRREEAKTKLNPSRSLS